MCTIQYPLGESLTPQEFVAEPPPDPTEHTLRFTEHRNPTGLSSGLASTVGAADRDASRAEVQIDSNDFSIQSLWNSSSGMIWDIQQLSELQHWDAIGYTVDKCQ